MPVEAWIFLVQSNKIYKNQINFNSCFFENTKISQLSSALKDNRFYLNEEI